MKDVTQFRKELNQQELEALFLAGIPFPYLLENSEFYHHNFYINSSVLIPRPETEYLVDLIVKSQKQKLKRILDVGTGSGVILLSLMSEDIAQIGVGVDISPEALEVAKINAQKLGLIEKVQLIQSDRLNHVVGLFDLIVSNPPYIKSQSHRSLVHHKVHEFEPHQALYLPDDFYAFWFEDFFQQVRAHLRGTFYMEGHELELDKLAEVLKRLGFSDVEVLNDLGGVKRFLKAKFEA